MSKYSRETVSQDFRGRTDVEVIGKKLVEVVADTRIVLDETKDIKDEPLRKQARMLKRILGEQTSVDLEGNVKERKYKDRPQNQLVSPVDPDARHGAKSDKKRFTGYKANITETVESRFITGIKAMPGNRPDGEITESLVQEQKRVGLEPPRLIGDTAYGHGAHPHYSCIAVRARKAQ